jgi:hypothetical protein
VDVGAAVAVVVDVQEERTEERTVREVRVQLGLVHAARPERDVAEVDV